MKRYQILAVVLLIFAMSVGSQMLLAQGDNGHKVMKQEQGKKEVVNSHCPIMGTEIDAENVSADLTRDFKQLKVGFCCTGCLAKWDNLSDGDKTEKLEAVTDKK